MLTFIEGIIDTHQSVLLLIRYKKEKYIFLFSHNVFKILLHCVHWNSVLYDNQYFLFFFPIMFTNAYFFRVMASADQDHTAQNVQPDLLSVLSAFVETVFNSSRWQPIMCDYFGLNSLNENVFQICLNAKKKNPKIFNPFPHNDTFWRPWETGLLKTLWEKEKLLVTSNFSFSHSVFYPFG